MGEVNHTWDGTRVATSSSMNRPRLSLRKIISGGCLSEAGSSPMPVQATGKISEIYFHKENTKGPGSLLSHYFIPISIFCFKAQTGKTMRMIFLKIRKEIQFSPNLVNLPMEKTDFQSRHKGPSHRTGKLFYLTLPLLNSIADRKYI